MAAVVGAPVPVAREVTTGIVALLALAVFINYVDRGNLSTAGPLFKDGLHLSNSQMGVLLSAFFWTYAPGQLPAGWLAQRVNVRYVLALGLALWSFSTVLTGLATTFTVVFALRLLLGVGESVFHPCNAKVLAEQASEHRRGVANGMVAAGQSLGSMFGTVFAGLLMVAVGWRWVFIVTGLLSLVWLAPWLLSTRGDRLRSPVADGSLHPICSSHVSGVTMKIVAIAGFAPSAGTSARASFETAEALSNSSPGILMQGACEPFHRNA